MSGKKKFMFPGANLNLDNKEEEEKQPEEEAGKKQEAGEEVASAANKNSIGEYPLVNEQIIALGN